MATAGRIIGGGLVAAGLIGMMAASGLLERDERRIERARERHAAELERAFDRFITQIERANQTLERVYEPIVERHEAEGDTAVVQRLRKEIDEATDLGTIISTLAEVDVEISRSQSNGSDDESNAQDFGHEQLIQAIGPAMFLGNGQAVQTSHLAKAEYVVLYFSASWCGPCKAYTPQLIEFYQQHGGGDRFEVVLVSSDRSAQQMGAYLRESGMPWPTIPYDRIEPSGIEQTFGCGAIPHVVILDGDAEVVLSTHSDRRDILLEKFATLLAESDS